MRGAWDVSNHNKVNFTFFETQRWTLLHAGCFVSSFFSTDQVFYGLIWNSSLHARYFLAFFYIPLGNTHTWILDGVEIANGRATESRKTKSTHVLVPFFLLSFAFGRLPVLFILIASIHYILGTQCVLTWLLPFIASQFRNHHSYYV